MTSSLYYTLWSGCGDREALGGHFSFMVYTGQGIN